MDGNAKTEGETDGNRKTGCRRLINAPVRSKKLEGKAQTKEEFMTAQKKGTAEGSSQGAAGSGGTKRKGWIKKSPVEIILEQVSKQEEKVAELRRELTKEEAELKKMQDATKLLSAK
jgi:hypothetical protein